MAEWFCRNRKAKGKRYGLQVGERVQSIYSHPDKSFHEECQTCERTKTCKECRVQKPAYRINHFSMCTECRVKTCVKCGKTKSRDQFTENEHGQLQKHCTGCKTKSKRCNTCGKVKPTNEYESYGHLICKQCKIDTSRKQVQR